MNAESAERLSTLTATVRDDLRKLGEPAANWPATPTDVDCDVLIVGAGQCGLAAAFALKRIGIANLRVVSRDDPGQEGPWRSFARMPTLRSPKTAPGPELGVASLAYESWHVARYGQAHYDALDLIATGDWAAYIDWFKATTEIPVEQNREMIDLIGGVDRMVAAFVDGGEISARQVVLATGMDAFGAPALPAPFDALPPELRRDCYDEIDFAALKGARLAVIGAASTAFDNAAAALEAGAGEVELYCRRPELGAVNRMKGVAAYGAVAHWADFDDATRWRFARLGVSPTAPPTGPTVARACRWPNFRILLGADIEAAEAVAGEAVIRANGVDRAYDAVLIAAGYAMDPPARPELAHVFADIACWRDRFAPPVADADPMLGDFPYLDPGFGFTEREPGAAPWLSRVRLFAGPAVVSMGRVTGESGNLKYGAPRLATAIARSLAVEDRDALFDASAAYDVAEQRFEDYRDRSRPASES